MSKAAMRSDCRTARRDSVVDVTKNVRTVCGADCIVYTMNTIQIGYKYQDGPSLLSTRAAVGAPLLLSRERRLYAPRGNDRPVTDFRHRGGGPFSGPRHPASKQHP